ncbi:MAG: hypothetical protein Q8P30_00640 [Candidatus Uhrbacteria bacterium]|nr:hypothetical protein [Candidatus Uhrbacteria bacterium]
MKSIFTTCSISSLVLLGIFSISLRYVDAAAGANSLVKCPNEPAVYYLANDGNRYVFPNEHIYYSWYANFDNVKTISCPNLANLAIGGVVHYQAGTKLVKTPSVRTVYAVEPNGNLSALRDERQAQRLFGEDWASRVDDLSVAFFTQYNVLEELSENQIPEGTVLKNEDGTFFRVLDGQLVNLKTYENEVLSSVLRSFALSFEQVDNTLTAYTPTLSEIESIVLISDIKTLNDVIDVPEAQIIDVPEIPEFTEHQNPEQSLYEIKDIEINVIDSSYDVANGNTSGWFTNDQESDVMLSGFDFNETGGSLMFNHQGGIASDGRRLMLADRNNNRVLIWNSLPTENAEPDLVLGQTNFNTNEPGTGQDQLNWPTSIATDGVRLVVADTENDRVLVWNTIPVTNGKPADFEISNNIMWPWAVWTDGSKLVVASTQTQSVLIWNTFPLNGDQEPDVVLHLDDFGTPRTIGSDGTNLMIGDHNAVPNNNDRGNFFWNEFPTKDNQMYDFFMVAPYTDADSANHPHYGEVLWNPRFTDDGKFVALGMTSIFVWDNFPTDGYDSPDYIIGGDYATEKELEPYRFNAGDSSGIAIANGKIYVSLNNENKIVVYNNIPTTTNTIPDFSIGSTDIYTNTLAENYFITNPVPSSDGTSLFVISDFDRKLYVWKQIPDESGANPDLVFKLPAPAWDSDIYNGKFIAAGTNTVYIWDEMPTKPIQPSIILQSPIGGVNFSQIQGVTMDDKYFYIADRDSNALYVFDGIPTKDDSPIYEFNIESPGRLHSDGEYLTVTSGAPGGNVLIYLVNNVTAEPLSLKGIVPINQPMSASVIDGSLFVADTVNNRVMIWNDVRDVFNKKQPNVILGAEEQNTVPTILRDAFYWPGTIFYDGNYLWIGEFKFSGRLMRFTRGG